MDIIVVEGMHDEARIKAVFPNASCIITNGREISQDTIDCIKELSRKNTIIIFTDPDSPGEKIRSIIFEAVPEAKHAFLRKKDCISRNHKKVGIEHASSEAIIEALSRVLSDNGGKQTITQRDLFVLGLTGSQNSAVLRNKISDILNIGEPNGKTFLKRLNMLGLSRKEVEELLCRVR